MIGELTEELEVDQDQVERRVADALADAEDAAMDAVGAILEREDRVDQREAAIVVAMPVDLHVGAGALDDVPGELDEVADAVRGDVADGVAQAQA